MPAASATPMARPKRVMATDDNLPQAIRARTAPPGMDELTQIVMKLQAQAILDQQLWVAVEDAFDVHAGRLEYLSHQDLQWNDDFATAVDGMKRATEQLDSKVGQQVAQVVQDLTATVLKAENELRVVISQADVKFEEVTQKLRSSVEDTRQAFVVVESAFAELQRNVVKTEELVKKGLVTEPQSGLFVDQNATVHAMSPKKHNVFSEYADPWAVGGRCCRSRRKDDGGDELPGRRVPGGTSASVKLCTSASVKLCSVAATFQRIAPWPCAGASTCG